MWEGRLPVHITVVIVFSGGESLCEGGENACIHDTGHCVFRGRMSLRMKGGENACIHDSGHCVFRGRISV